MHPSLLRLTAIGWYSGKNCFLTAPGLEGGSFLSEEWDQKGGGELADYICYVGPFHEAVGLKSYQDEL